MDLSEGAIFSQYDLQLPVNYVLFYEDSLVVVCTLFSIVFSLIFTELFAAILLFHCNSLIIHMPIHKQILHTSNCLLMIFDDLDGTFNLARITPC
jgi:hypothetical protein